MKAKKINALRHIKNDSLDKNKQKDWIWRDEPLISKPEPLTKALLDRAYARILAKCNSHIKLVKGEN